VSIFLVKMRKQFSSLAEAKKYLCNKLNQKQKDGWLANRPSVFFKN